MKITLTKHPLHRTACDAVVVTHFEDDSRPAGAGYALDKRTSGLIGALLKDGDFKGKLFETSLLYTRRLITSKRIIVIGMGKRSECDAERIRMVFSKTARTARDLRLRSFAASMDFDGAGPGPSGAARAAVEGALLGLYRFIPYKTEQADPKRDPGKFIIVGEGQGLRRAAETAEIISKAVSLARDLVSSPANQLTPAVLARKAKELLTGRGVNVTVYDEKRIQKIGMNTLLGVARGSDEGARLIIMEYRGGRGKERPLVLVGKGITFDSGGLNLKPAEAMGDMKEDMAGAAAVIGTLRAAADLGIPAHIVGIVPAAENLPSGRACKPGDVLTSLSGTTIEVTNTDAEGRLVLADALTWAHRYRPRAIIDIATLTGGCIIALGNGISGLLGTDETLTAMLKDAGKETGEHLWELPLWRDYEELMKSDIADVKNAAGRPAAAITAALFLKKFVGDCPWAHLDIAGTASLTKERSYIPKGASGVGVRLLVQFLEMWVRRQDGADSHRH
jgi:leucyl aminopeptidase